MQVATLQSAIAAARAQLTTKGEAALRDAVLPSRLAFLLLPVLEVLAAADLGDASDLLLELVGKEHRRTLLAVLPNPTAALRALNANALLHNACQALRTALDGQPTITAPTISQRMEAERIENSRQYSSGGDLTVHEASPNSEEERRKRDLRTYLTRTASECNALLLAQLDPADADARSLPLNSVYINLHVMETVNRVQPKADAVRGARRSTDMERDKPLSVIEALGEAPGRRLLLLGRPGSGKSTFLNYLAACLSEATLAARQGNITAPWLQSIPGWTIGPCIPIRLILRDLARFEPLASGKHGDMAPLFAFLHQQLEQIGCSAAFEPIKDALANGQAALLVDGLDEVTDKAILERVAEVIKALADSFRDCPVLVTCRILDYQTEKLRHLPGFTVHTLADLTDEQVEQFVHNWYRTLAASGRRSLSQATDDIRELLGAIAAREELRELSSLPLLITLMALVHAYKGSLPDARALLYDECVDLLLRWRQPRGETTLLARLELPNFRQSDLQSLLARLGYDAHSSAQPASIDTPPADLSSPAVLSSLAQGFAAFDAPRKDELAARLLRLLAQGNGLLMQRGPDVYTFPHRTFQEFLAGYYLLGQPNYIRTCLQLAAKTHWHETLLLMIGYQVFKSNDLERPLMLAEQLLQRGPAEQVLAGEILNLVGRERVRAFDLAMLQQDGLIPRTRNKLLTLLTTSHVRQAPAHLRHRAGLAAGYLCYSSTAALTKGMPPPQPDARLPLVFIGTSAKHSDVWRRAFVAYWCSVDWDSSWYRDDKDGELERITLPYSYKIARYPITNADFARFVAMGGYDNQDWWTKHGWLWLQRSKQTKPMLFNSIRYNNPLQPVVGVTWYEAAAYCCWLTTKLREADLLPDIKHKIRLPTLLEWERAVRHIDKRPYPWGNLAPDAERANYADTKLGLPSPVGCFPHGRAACGALDLVGNVDEWTATLWEEQDRVEARNDFSRSETPIYRWKSYADQSERLLYDSRFWSDPSSETYNLGFRLAWSL